MADVCIQMMCKMMISGGERLRCQSQNTVTEKVEIEEKKQIFRSAEK